VDFRPINHAVPLQSIKGASLPGSVLDEKGNLCPDYFDHRCDPSLRDYLKIIGKMILRRNRSRVPPSPLLELDACQEFATCLCAVLSKGPRPSQHSAALQ
jgi:hypothetical protein